MIYLFEKNIIVSYFGDEGILKRMNAFLNMDKRTCIDMKT